VLVGKVNGTSRRAGACGDHPGHRDPRRRGDPHGEEELVSSLPGHLSGSRFDYEWDHLQDALFEHKDCEASSIYGYPSMATWPGQRSSEFGNIAARDRGFRR
jgi:hypothetical protein